MKIFNDLIINDIELLESCKDSLFSKQKRLVTYFNQHCYNNYLEHSDYRTKINENFVTYIDGIAIYMVMKYLYRKNVKLFNATEINHILFNYFIKEKLNIYIIGGKFNEEFIKNKSRQNSLILKGYQNGFFSEAEYAKSIANINSKKIDVLVLGLGVPNQELLAYKISNSTDVPLVLCVGNFLEFYYGSVKRAPKIFHNSGFEWIYRLFSEPKRLWKRYLLGIPIFFFRIIKNNIFKEK